MLKKQIIASVAVGLFLVAPAYAADKHDPNPRKDPDVQRGYDQHQKEHQNRDKDAKQTKDGVDSNQGRANPDGTVRGSSDHYTVIKDDSTTQSPGR